jgi:hypothetical protein
MVLEPDVTFTDYGLAVECAVLTTWIVRLNTPDQRLRAWVATFFATIGLAALTGGTVHGFLPDERSLGFRVLWPLTLLAIGATAVSAWAIGTRLVLDERVERTLIRIVAAAFAVYAAVVLFVTQTFAVAVFHYAPSAVFLLSALMIRYVGRRTSGSGLGAAAVALMLVAASVQYVGVAVHPVYFNHNALYHALQGVALILFYLATRSLLDSPSHGG